MDGIHTFEIHTDSVVSSLSLKLLSKLQIVFATLVCNC